MCPIFWVCDKSRAASTSSRMYKGAGLNKSNDKMSDKATKDLCPPDNSLRDSFQLSPKATLTSKPSRTSRPSGGCNLALAPGKSVEKMDPKSLFT